MDNLKSHSDHSFLSSSAKILIATVCALLLLYWGKPILIPLLLAFLVATFLYPLVRYFEKKHFGKALAAASAVVIFFLFLLIVGFFFGEQFLQFLKALPELKVKLDTLMENLQTSLWQNYHIKSDPGTSYINSALSKVVVVAGNTLPLVLELLVLFVLFLFFTFYMLYHRKLLQKFIFSFLKAPERKKVEEITIDLHSVINGYVKGLLLEMIIFITASFLLLMLVGVKYALLMAVFAGVLNLIPYLGIYAATAINAILVLAENDPTKGIEVAAVFIFVHVIDANFVLPRIVGSSVKMNPFVTLIAVVVGNLIWGIPGMFLFIPLTAIVRVLGERLSGLRSWAILIGPETEPGKIKIGES